jgi:hypothetical protein
MLAELMLVAQLSAPAPAPTVRPPGIKAAPAWTCEDGTIHPCEVCADGKTSHNCRAAGKKTGREVEIKK